MARIVKDRLKLVAEDVVADFNVALELVGM